MDIQSDFDRLPDMVIESALDTLGITDCLRASINAFLAGRTLWVRVGRAVSDPMPVITGVLQSSVLSPFLFNLVLAGLPAMLPVDKRYPTLCSLYIDDVALWGNRLVVSPTKTEALLVHPRVTARRAIPSLVLGDQTIPWSQAVTYLGLRINHHLTWIPAVKLATFKATMVQTALYEGAATAVRTNALPLVQLAPHRKEQLERQQGMAIRRFMGLPRQSPVPASVPYWRRPRRSLGFSLCCARRCIMWTVSTGP
ncbi:hypothetical protein HPB52_019248 [Rhipicephalus sanguineus]|uniref:Tick transposon n=1 Tax=Rhipicephalus sanguineus TaxID=34632 RepID=A0A9D4T054_RHISA|nr:hypothetical protein HPB52_019248 [Rhipicephalus sanguineus]